MSDKQGVVLDYDATGNLVSLEILDALKRVTETRKVEFQTTGYRISIPDTEALKHGHVRVVDESGEDYLYPKSLFLPINVSASLRKAILRTA